MAYIGNTSPSRFVSNRAASVYSGDGSTTAFTLEQAVVQDEDIFVSVDGVIQEPSVAYAVSNGTTLTFTAAPSSNSGNNIFVYYLASQVGTVGHPATQSLTATNGTLTGTLDVTGATTLTGALAGTTATLTTADNNAQLTLVSTDADANRAPTLALTRNSGSPADNDLAGVIKFNAKNDAGEDIELFEINTTLIDASDGTEDARMIFNGITNGASANKLSLNNSEIVINDDSTATDFRIESDSMSHQMHMNGSNGKFTINSNSEQSPASHFTVFFESNSYSAFAAQMTDTGNGSGFLICRKGDGTTIGQVKRNGTSDEVQYVTTSDYRLKENVNYDFDATSVTKQLKPCKFNWIRFIQ